MTDQADTRALIAALRRITGGTAVTEATHAAADALEATLPTDDERERTIAAILPSLAGYDLHATQKDQIITDLLDSGFGFRRSPVPPEATGRDSRQVGADTDREALARLLGADQDDRGGNAPTFAGMMLHPRQARAIAAAILAAGWRPPLPAPSENEHVCVTLSSHPDEEAVTTVDELDALPVGSILRDSQGDGIEVVAGQHAKGFSITGVSGMFSANWVGLPARVLYRPTPEGSGQP